MIKYLCTKHTPKNVQNYIYKCDLLIIKYWFDNGFDVNTFDLKHIKNININNKFILGIIELLIEYKCIRYNINDYEILRYVSTGELDKIKKIIRCRQDLEKIYNIIIKICLVNHYFDIIEFLKIYYFDINFKKVIKYSDIVTIKYIYKNNNIIINKSHIFASIIKNNVIILQYILKKYNSPDLNYYLSAINIYQSLDGNTLLTVKYIYDTYSNKKYSLDNFYRWTILECVKYDTTIKNIDQLSVEKSTMEIYYLMVCAIDCNNYLMLNYLYKIHSDTRTVER